MSQASVDQDINCRVIGRCTHGEPIDRELDDLIPQELADEDGSRPAAERPEKLFLYARYNALLTDDGLNELHLGELNAASMRKMDAVENADSLAAIGAAVGEQVDLEQFGPFVRGA